MAVNVILIVFLILHELIFRQTLPTAAQLLYEHGQRMPMLGDLYLERMWPMLFLVITIGLLAAPILRDKKDKMDKNLTLGGTLLANLFILGGWLASAMPVIFLLEEMTAK